MHTIMKKRKSGVLCHISSLVSSFGIGDLGQNAYDFVDYLGSAKQSIWQILPINPTSFGDSPYSSFSSFAGNPLFICPQLLVDWDLLSPADIVHNINFPENKIDYSAVIKLKTAIFKKAYANFSPNRWYMDFTAKNAGWLEDYALFKALKEHFIAERAQGALPNGQNADYYYGAVWSTWDSALVARCPDEIDKYRELLANEIGFHKFLQFIFYKQYALLKKYAADAGIMIAGDIPIFVAYDSADVWANQGLFQLAADGTPTSVAGVPPDYFSEDGQLWGNPLYDWEANKQTDYIWWSYRIAKAMEVFDIIRLDHFRGFYSYWEVPYGAKTAKTGKWQRGPGLDFFNSIKKRLGDLPIIAEDLGIITPNVEKLLTWLGLPGMRVLQFAFDQNPKNTHLPHNFTTSNLVVYSGTHDNNTTAGWYADAPEAERDLFRRYLNVSGNFAPWDMIRAALLSTANLAIIPIQDLLSLDSAHRTNTPGTPQGNWQFRLSPHQLDPAHAKNLAYLTKLSSRLP